MTTRKILGSIVVLVWLATLVFVSGPVRWEYAHTYEHLIGGLGASLPTLTEVVGLPILGLGPASFRSAVVRALFWGFTWLAPLLLLVGIWRAGSREMLSDWLLYGGAIYCSVMFLLTAVVAASLWIPFGLL